MELDPRTPVLVGAGVASQRCEDPGEALEACDLMVAALERAAEDAGSPKLLAEADSVGVPRGFWEYSDAARLVADRLGAGGARTILAGIGILQQTLLSRACQSIADGAAEVVLVTGGEARYRTLRAGIAGKEISDTEQTGVEPDTNLQPHGSLWAELEAERGLLMPVAYYTIMENALRYSEGLGLDAHRDEVAALWADFSRVATGNPHAWNSKAVSAEEIRNATPRNKMLAFPYTKLHNSQWNVDQAAGLILCSAEKARAHGVPRERWVFPLSGTESNHLVPVSARADMHRCPAVQIGGGRALELAGKTIDAVEHLDIYSCFPSAVRIQARELGIASDRPLTVTGGMTFAGGPLNNYVLQAVARMVEVLRGDPGSSGLVTSISGMISKQGFGVWSTEPNPAGFACEDVSEAVAAGTETRELVGDYSGPATVASYTVQYQGDASPRGTAVCDLPDGRRTVANTDDPALMEAMVSEEFCGRTVQVGDGGTLG
ncbi:MAG: acetyl-CoA acetyltransferase [Deltaproteobacteria bacterium]|nr:acetyl-CoA acetyltransferase [Deltaproteobacteria bacterium]MBW2417884.1 acetyl-CoA acetyltransferase [Deltaproteobacteria bacterium]